MAFVLEAQNISQSEGQDYETPSLFQGIHFRWESPSLQVIMGASGSGKSTLLRSIGGVWKPKTGKVFASGHSLWEDGHNQNPQVLREIGFAFQNNALFSSLRVLENICFAHRQRFPEMSEQERQKVGLGWLDRVGLLASASLFPHELSGGMQKRLSIARTLALQPNYIFLDDPTAGLDPITSQSMSDLINSLLKGSQSLVVIVTNDPDRALDWGPEIHYLIDGKLHSPSPHAEYRQIAERFL